MRAAVPSRLGRQLAGGAEAIGLGRSIHGVIDRALIEHARETVDRHIARGDTAVSAQFVTTTATGSLLHVVLAPVRSQAARSAAMSCFWTTSPRIMPPNPVATAA